MQSDLYLINLQWNYAGSDKTRFHFSFRHLLKLLILIGPAYESTPIVHNASSFLTWLRFHFNKYNMRNKNYTDICQFSLIVSEEIKLQFICSAHDCDHSFSISNLWAKLTASAYKNWKKLHCIYGLSSQSSRIPNLPTGM